MNRPVSLSTSNADSIERALCRRLAGAAEPVTESMAAVARRHRTHLLLAASLTASERSTGVGVQLTRALTMAAALEGWRADDTRQLLGVLAAAGIDALVLKGTGLAYTIYAEPHHRPRLDIDLLIDRASLDGAERALAAQGWTHPVERRAELAEPQRHYVKTGAAGYLSHLDLHWKIANPRVFADAMSFEALCARAVPVPRLDSAARTLSVVDALLLACIHRVAHHADGVDLLWMWDIHLLMERMAPEERTSFTALARSASLCAVCQRGIELAGDLFGTKGSTDVADQLRALAAGSREPSATFVGGVRPLTVLGSDLGTLGWRDRFRLVGEHVFPSIVYLRARYPRCPKMLLPLAYLVRVVGGAPAWFRR